MAKRRAIQGAWWMREILLHPYCIIRGQLWQGVAGALTENGSYIIIISVVLDGELAVPCTRNPL